MGTQLNITNYRKMKNRIIVMRFKAEISHAIFYIENIIGSVLALLRRFSGFDLVLTLYSLLIFRLHCISD